MLEKQFNFAVLVSLFTITELFYSYVHSESIFGTEPLLLVAYLVEFMVIQSTIALTG